MPGISADAAFPLSLTELGSCIMKPVCEAGVAAIFGPGTNIPQAAAEVVDLIRARRPA